MADKIKCPFCNELNEADHKFCVYCGKEFPVSDEVCDSKENGENAEVISCPACNSENHKESIECKKCGHLLKEHIKTSFHPSGNNYKRCPRCGNILLSEFDYCIMCDYDFTDLKIDHNPHDDFFKTTKYKEYEKNIDFFKDINKSNDYNAFLFEFKEYCGENNVDLKHFDIGMTKCPQCSDFFSFISPHFIRTRNCPHCGKEFDFYESEEVYCLNCGRPVKEGQIKCSCGYELADIECRNCNVNNPYTNSYCTSCGSMLRHSHVIIQDRITPRGCTNKNNNKLFLDINFLKNELLKNPYQKNGRISKQTLQRDYQRYNKIIDEIGSRWWIVSPVNCKSCLRIINPVEYDCPTCHITHQIPSYEDRIKELKTIENNYAETSRVDYLSNLKWDYKFSEKTYLDYLKSLAPLIGESQLEYRQRLLKEWWENSAILYLIKSEWNRYFKDNCINCGSNLEAYNLYCPSCDMRKDVPALGVLLNDEYVEKGIHINQYADFSKSVKSICRDNGADISFFDNGVAGCPNCSNYFHYLTPDFIKTHDCPHCGTHFEIHANIFYDEWDIEGVSYEEWQEMQGLK